MSKSYQGEEVIEFKQTPGKIYCLNPAIERHLPDGKDKKILDVGCGDGFYYTMCSQKGFEYSGLDISEDMIRKAKTQYLQGSFLTGSCFELTKLYEKASFDVVISSMLFPEFESLENFKKALREIKGVLKDGGIFILGTAHPSFDMYMRKFLFNADNVETNFYSYYDSEKLFRVISKTMGVVFEDHHWTFENYVNELINCGFLITGIDECKIIDQAKEETELYEQKIKIPSYVLFKAERVKAEIDLSE